MRKKMLIYEVILTIKGLKNNNEIDLIYKIFIFNYHLNKNINEFKVNYFH